MTLELPYCSRIFFLEPVTYFLVYGLIEYIHLLCLLFLSEVTVPVSNVRPTVFMNITARASVNGIDAFNPRLI